LAIRTRECRGMPPSPCPRECLSSPDSGQVCRSIVHLERGSAMDLARYVVDAVVLEGRSYREVARPKGSPRAG
jgi:hypothetical protein